MTGKHRAMQLASALLAGLLFGGGLLISGMSDPARVLGFLDVAGAWDPSLAFVMAGAIAVAAPAFAWVRRHERTLRWEPVSLPDRRTLTPRLIGGSALFGLGWGLVGLCPGPALVVTALGVPRALAFVVPLAIGLALASVLSRRAATLPASPSSCSCSSSSGP